MFTNLAAAQGSHALRFAAQLIFESENWNQRLFPYYYCGRQDIHGEDNYRLLPRLTSIQCSRLSLYVAQAARRSHWFATFFNVHQAEATASLCNLGNAH